MSKSYRYTILTLFLAVVFGLGSMEGMHLILKARESRLLTQQGSVAVEAPVRAWQVKESSAAGEIAVSPALEGYTLSEEQVVEVLNNREGAMILNHEPVEGQIPMEAAMEASVFWLSEMGFIDAAAEEPNYMTARLTVAVKRDKLEIPLEPYHSFWFVQYYGPSMMVFMHVNAVTGRVWSADVTLYDNLPEKIPTEKLPLFAELSGLQVMGADTLISDQEGTRAFMMTKERKLSVGMDFRRSQMYPTYMVVEDGKAALYETGPVERESAELYFTMAVNNYN